MIILENHAQTFTTSDLNQPSDTCTQCTSDMTELSQIMKSASLWSNVIYLIGVYAAITTKQFGLALVMLCIAAASFWHHSCDHQYPNPDDKPGQRMMADWCVAILGSLFIILYGIYMLIKNFKILQHDSKISSYVILILVFSILALFVFEKNQSTECHSDTTTFKMNNNNNNDNNENNTTTKPFKTFQMLSSKMYTKGILFLSNPSQNLSSPMNCSEGQHIKTMIYHTTWHLLGGFIAILFIYMLAHIKQVVE